MKQTTLTAFFFLLTISLFSQTEIGGIVLDENGEPVPFANVIFSNTTQGTTTNENGVFELSSNQNQKAVDFSFLGYKTETIQLANVSNLKNIKVRLEPSSESLSEVKIYKGKTPKKNNPAIDILRKIWKNKRDNGVKKFDQYAYRKYEKLEFDLNKIDSALIKSPIFNGMEFIFEDLDTNRVTGKTYLPIFLNESVTKVYGDNKSGDKLTELVGNKNSGFSDNQILISTVRDVYDEIDIYDNYLKFFDKNFVSPLSKTGINVYNYVLADTAYRDDKYCYKIVYYPRRDNELTFSGDFWVNDTTWAVKSINLEMSEGANLNWVKGVYIEQEFDVLNDSVFLMKKDFFQADFAIREKEDARGVYGKKTVLYDQYEFDNERPSSFYNKKVNRFREEVYNRDDNFWEENRLESLNRDEKGVYQMLDTLKNVKQFQRLYNVTTALATGYVSFDGWDYGPIFSTFGFNDVEGVRIRGGGRTYFGQHDKWRIEGYGAYGFKDKKFKYGVQGKILLDPDNRLIISGGNRRDVEQLGINLTNTTDVLGRSLASSALISTSNNNSLSSINLSVLSVEIEPWENLIFRASASYREIEAASEGFKLDYYTDDEQTTIASGVDQVEISNLLMYTPGKKTAGYGVEREIIDDNYPTIFLNYTLGVKNIFNSDFDYKKLQLFYDQPLMIGGFGRAKASIEAGKTFGDVPLALLSVVPGNQTYFQLYNTFSLLDYYEFVTDTYVAAHFEHNFNGRLFSRIPLLKDLNLREIVGVRGVWGEISESNKQLDASGIFLRAPTDKAYWEYSVGVGNIFKVLRVDAHFRGNYFDNPDARSFGVTINFGFYF
ncbi:DUF5686 family protein [Zunongwangia sp.]|uniref:DUF5686 and carboxypeptidase-like regulatory domain-containing protein n=1 Tax=Zunongwangia sp. TaxID=1965325 RepID=UPI003AA908BD